MSCVCMEINCDISVWLSVLFSMYNKYVNHSVKVQYSHLLNSNKYIIYWIQIVYSYCRERFIEGGGADKEWVSPISKFQTEILIQRILM